MKRLQAAGWEKGEKERVNGRRKGLTSGRKAKGGLEWE